MMPRVYTVILAICSTCILSACADAQDGGTISGRVVNRTTASPVQGIQVRLTELGSDSPGIVVESSEDGGYRANGLVAGRYLVLIENIDPDRFASNERRKVSKIIDLQPASHVDNVDLDLESPSQVSGSITIDGSLAAGATVEVSRHRRPLDSSDTGIPSRTDSNGRFRVIGLSSSLSPLTLQVIHPDVPGRFFLIPSIKLDPSNETKDVTLDIKRLDTSKVSLSGTITFKGKKLSKDAIVRAILEGPELIVITQFNSETHTYQAVDVPAGRYQLRVSLRDTNDTFVSEQALTIEEGATSTLDVDITTANKIQE